MSILLIQGCSKSKNAPGEPVEALDLYSGYFFKIIKKAIRDGDFNKRIDIWILSAKYGLIEDETEIQHYDRRMDSKRAAELAPQVSEDLEHKGVGEYDTVVVNVGNDYRDALSGLEALESTDVHHIDGEGIGVKGHKLKQIIRGDFSVPQKATSEKESV